MNVTSKGYFTTSFLDKQKQNSPRGYYHRGGYDDIDYDDDMDDYSGDWDSEMYNPHAYGPEEVPSNHPSPSMSRVSDYRFGDPTVEAGQPSLRTKRSRSTLATTRTRASPAQSPVLSKKQMIPPSPTQSSHSQVDPHHAHHAHPAPEVGDSLELTEISNDPDFLEQEITPAQLNILQNNAPRYTPYKPGKRAPFQVRMSPTPPSKKDYSGYYIDQKIKFDEADFKPKLYTHKTFREVFENKEENTDKYNPMEYVFDGRPEETNLRRAFKSLQVKMGKDDYSNYDYYENKERPAAPQTVFVKGSDEEGDPTGEKAAAEKLKKNKKFSKALKRKMKEAKKELGRNFMSNSERQREIHELMKEREDRKQKKKGKNIEEESPAEALTESLDDKKLDELIEQLQEEEAAANKAEEEAAKEVAEEEEEQKDANEAEQENVVAAVPSSASAQNPNFSPLWNYLLSWIVYDTVGKNQPSGNVEIEEIERPGSKSIKSKKSSKSLVKSVKGSKKINFKNIKKNYSTVVSKWNEPVTALFQEPSSRSMISRRVRGTTSSTHSSHASEVDDMIDGETQEFTIEVDDDGSEANLELYYNPITKQLEGTPPTSMGSLVDGSNPQSSGRRRYFDTSRGPVAIISNINALIKNIKLMQIIFAPIDVIGESFPNLQTVVILIELVIFMWFLYELSLLIDALCMMVKAVCAPMIAMGRFMNRIM